VAQLLGHPETLALTNRGSALSEAVNVMLEAFAGMDSDGFVDHPKLFSPVMETGLEGAPLPQNGMPLGQEGFEPVLKIMLL
jgi:hypothetical protein